MADGTDGAAGTTASTASTDANRPDMADIVQRFHADLALPDAALVLFFCSPALDLDRVSTELVRRFGPTPLLGCTTAGEFGPAGYRDGTLVGLSLPAEHFHVASRSFGALADFGIAQGRELLQSLLRDLERQRAGRGRAGGATPSFALLLIDGLSGCEERVTRTLQAALGGVPLVGGSAGDGLDFGRTGVWADGRFASDRAVLALVCTDLPVQAFMTQHFVPTDRRAVVTAADPARRTVHEIDGLPAAQAYAHLIGVPVEALDAAVFAAAPMAVMIGGEPHIRSISQALPDGSLTFHCAVDEGIVLRTTQGVDLLGKLERTFERLQDRLGPLQAVIGCDCILRRLEIEQAGQADAVGALMQRHRVVGFNTYGEQFRGVHVNQTFTGLAIGLPPGERHA
jgi:hypothetical protein